MADGHAGVSDRRAAMNAWDWMLLTAVLVGAGFALAHLLKSKKNGCCGNCHSCGGCCERK
ncbi:MAG: FeoB-associated Cys-rich membrane protein [Clostridiales bacterium]|nr:FeoB-associated Cys-rich membrane protein [Clostridiales bacterium]